MKNASAMFSTMNNGRVRLLLASALLTACAGGCATGSPDAATKIVGLGRMGLPGDKIVVQHDPSPSSPGPHQNTILVSSETTEVFVKVVPVIGSASHQKKIVIKTRKPFVPTVSEEPAR